MVDTIMVDILKYSHFTRSTISYGKLYCLLNHVSYVCLQGSFECVRSGGVRRLDSCGPLPRRMRVQANDDSYEATKDRMSRTIAAEQSKWYNKIT